MAQKTWQTHNRFVLDSLEEGDLVQFDRGMYSHWAVYAGHKQVIHLTGIGGQMVSDPGHAFLISGVLFNKAVVMIDKFWTVAGNSKATKNNSYDSEARSFGAMEIVQRAQSRLGSLTYSILWSNCEHFASWCRYGSKLSKQADKVVTVGVMSGAVAVVVLLIYSWFGVENHDADDKNDDE